MNATLETSPQLEDYLDIVDTAVATISRRLPSHIGREDLATVGKLALLAALGQVHGDESEIRSYCFVRVRGAMLDELRRLDPLSRRTRDLLNVVQRVQQDLTGRLRRSPTRAEIAAGAGLTLAEVQKALDAAEAQDEFAPFEWESVADHSATLPSEHAALDDLKLSLRSALERLSSIQAVVLQRYYFEEATLETIADEIGVSKERVRQIRNAAESKLRGDFVVLSLWQSLFAVS